MIPILDDFFDEKNGNFGFENFGNLDVHGNSLALNHFRIFKNNQVRFHWYYDLHKKVQNQV